ncbi:MAG: amidohydrolase [Gammaproteobacteria bacterium]|nr:MAG: amidohydrolase [Gammaproteobacteria bacterium]
MKDLKISLVQTALIWQQAKANCDYLAELLISDNTNTDLIVLPEMFNSGFTLNASKVAETMEGETIAWMKKLSANHDAAVTGSLVICENNINYNRMVIAFPDGQTQYYDKKHLFRMANEHKRYGSGNERVVIQWRDWRIALYVCYDLRFPVWCRNQNDTDLMLFVASWPAARASAWQILLRARAMENLCYVCGVNRIGRDANDIDYQGDSGVIDMAGDDVTQLGAADCLETVTLSADSLAQFRKRFPTFLDADSFSIS